jgi:SAM-dependent methyltransferase
MGQAFAMIKVHLGCGKRNIPGFVHVDLDDHSHIDHRHAIDRLPMFDDDAVDLIYACHALEYFDRERAKEVLAEWRRVLRPDGILRLAVPDFEALVQVYEQEGGLERILGPLYGRMEIDAPEGKEVLYHKTVYDFSGLKSVLEGCGFERVRRYDWRATEHKDLDDFSQAYTPHMDKENGLLISLNVEADKA